MADQHPTSPTPPDPAQPTGTVQPGATRTLSTGGVPLPGTQTTDPPGPKAQSEIGPTTFGGPGGPVAHGANDPETQAAYAGGHPSVGIAAQKQAASARTGNALNRPTTGGQPGQPASSQTAGQPQPATSTTGTQKVRMLRDEAGHTSGQELDLPADEAQRLIASGAAQAV